MYITSYPLDEYREYIKKCKTVNNCLTIEPNRAIKTAGILIDINERISKNKGNKFYTAKLEDETGTINLIYFPMRDELGKKYASIFFSGIDSITPVIIEGRVKEDSFGRSIVVSSIESLKKQNKIIQKQFTIDTNNKETEKEIISLLESYEKGSNIVIVNGKRFENLRISDTEYRVLLKYNIKPLNKEGM